MEATKFYLQMGKRVPKIYDYEIKYDEAKGDMEEGWSDNF
jgi:hypothetical protein